MNESSEQQLPVSFDEWEFRAREVLAKGPFDYIAGGAGAEDTIRRNREAFRSWRLQPLMLRNVSKRDTRVTLFGQTYPAPILLAPLSIQGIAHPQGELASARAAAALGASAILIGRPYIYGLAVAGEAGVRRVIENLLTDLNLTMANCGIRSLGELNRSFLYRR